MNLSCLIIDDEPGAIKVLETYTQKLDYIRLMGHCYNAVEAYAFLRNQPADLVFLDINMPEIDGFAFLEMLEKPPMVIFTTAYSDYALKSYEYNAIDYLYKPIRFERFIKAVEKAIRWKQLNRPVIHMEHIDLKIDGRVQQIRLEEIIYMQSLGNYVQIISPRKSWVTQITTKELEDKLPKNIFIRVHKSYIVNASKITRIEGENLYIDTFPIPIGKTYKKYLQEFIYKK